MTDLRAIGRFAALPMFAALDETDLELLLESLVRRVQARKGTILYLQGEYDRHAYLLDRGTARLLRVEGDVAERVVRELERGALVGQGTLYLAESRDVTLEATSDASFFVIDGAEFSVFCSQHPDLTSRLAPREDVQRKRDTLRLPWQRADEVLLHRSRLTGWALTTRRLVHQDLLGRRQAILRHVTSVHPRYSLLVGRWLDRGRVVISLEDGSRMVWRAVSQPHDLADLIFSEVGRDRARAQAEAMARARRAMGGNLPPESPPPQPDTLLDGPVEWLVPDLRRLADWFDQRLIPESRETPVPDPPRHESGE